LGSEHQQRRHIQKIGGIQSVDPVD